MEFTNRGFSLLKFKDKYGAECSLQESSSFDPSIWFGVESGHLEACTWTPDKDNDAYTRMHLTQKQVQELLPLLQRFAATGSLTQKINDK